LYSSFPFFFKKHRFLVTFIPNPSHKNGDILKNLVQNTKLFCFFITKMLLFPAATGRLAASLPFPLDTPSLEHYNINVKVL